MLFENPLNAKEFMKVSLAMVRWFSLYLAFAQHGDVCVRSTAALRVLQTYDQIMKTITVLADDKSVRGDALARIAGLLKQGQRAKIYYGVIVLCRYILHV